MDRNTLLWDNNTYGTKSLSARRAWIEMFDKDANQKAYIMSLSARRAWIEMLHTSSAARAVSGSLSARRAWIEMIGM